MSAVATTHYKPEYTVTLDSNPWRIRDLALDKLLPKRSYASAARARQVADELNERRNKSSYNGHQRPCTDDERFRALNTPYGVWIEDTGLTARQLSNVIAEWLADHQDYELWCVFAKANDPLFAHASLQRTLQHLLDGGATHHWCMDALDAFFADYRMALAG